MKALRCPYLGQKVDPGTALDFPSPGNLCHRAATPGAIRLEHQESTCLTGLHTRCPVYMAAAGQPIPRSIRAPLSPDRLSQRSLLLLGLPLVALLLAGVLFALNGKNWLANSNPFAFQAGSGAQEPLRFNLFSPAAGMTPEPNPIPNTSGQQRPTDCPIPAGWVPYTVLPTDSLFRLSVVMGVAVQDLQRANCLGGETVLLPGEVLYVPEPVATQPAPTSTPRASIATATVPPPPAPAPEQPEQPVVQPTQAPPPETQPPPPTETAPTPTATEPPLPTEPLPTEPLPLPTVTLSVPLPTATLPPTSGGGFECEGESVTVKGNNQTLVFTGICSITVTGNNNHITIPLTATVQDDGNRNVFVRR